MKFVHRESHIRKILFVVTAKESIRLLGGIPSLLSADGWEVHVASSGPATPKGEPRGVLYHPIEIARTPNVKSDLLTAVALLQLVRNVKPAVVVGATPKASFWAILTAWLHRVPNRVYFLWGLRLETAREPLRSLLWIAERLTSAMASRVISVSPSLTKRYREERLCDLEKISLLGNGSSHGVDLEVFRPSAKHEKTELRIAAEKLGLRPGVPTIGFIGRLTFDKGLRYLAASREELDKCQLDHQLLLVGRDESNGKIVELMNKFGRASVISDFVDNPARFFQMIDVLCLPSLREGMPNVCLEAAASGVPVVTTNATGAVDSVSDEVTGLIVQAGETEQLSEALKRLLADKSLRLEFGKNGREWAGRHFSKRVVERSYLDFFNGLVPRS